MSSMLKKTGGLSFKPKASRRPGAGSAKPSAGSTSTSTTRAPTTEPPSQASTPAASNPSTPAVTELIEAIVNEQNKPIPAESLPTPVDPQTPLSVRAPRTNSYLSTHFRTSAIATSIILASEPPRPTTDVTSHVAQPVHSVEIGTNTPSTTDASPQSSAATPTTASQPSGPEEEEAVVGPLTAPPSPPPTSSTDATVSQSGESAASQPPAPKKRAPRKRKSTTTDDVANTEESAPKKKRQRTKSTTRAAEKSSEDTNTDAPKPTRRRKREPTPENAEELTVDHSTMTVGELTKDLGIGKRFRHAEEIEQRAREARAKYRLKKLERQKRQLGLLPPEDDEDTLQAGDNENGETRGAAMAQLGASMESGASQGVGYDVVDGQIVVHAASLVVDRHNQDMSTLEEVEENDFTNLVTSASFAKRVQAPGNWTDEDTEKFYRLLGMFGTDFETISRLFPGKNRRAIKLKFNKEERLRPNRINAAMMVRGQKKVNIDIEEYKATQRQWQAKDTILEEHARLAEEHERDVARLREERRAAGLIDDDQAGAAKANAANAANNGQQNDEVEVIEEDADALRQGEQGEQNMDVDMDAQPEGIQV
ncbi:hypothetical protein O1611_g7254 [Lasiodiplodia mahajangana]|uniref:Uncharacterized protein n=1 Tax=Lasiodiplodia mahajangana TaxID=1108764 RepID=A0ACC2JGN1_9PEZI|nr:hypothetical protein O1611_g7254 [Lasiodiplodia mahajangana]